MKVLPNIFSSSSHPTHSGRVNLPVADVHEFKKTFLTRYFYQMSDAHTIAAWMFPPFFQHHQGENKIVTQRSLVCSSEHWTHSTSTTKNSFQELYSSKKPLSSSHTLSSTQQYGLMPETVWPSWTATGLFVPKDILFRRHPLAFFTYKF